MNMKKLKTLAEKLFNPSERTITVMTFILFTILFIFVMLVLREKVKESEKHKLAFKYHVC